MTERRIEKFKSVLRARQPGMTLILEDIHDPHNVSAVFRSADAVGVAEIQLLYTIDKFPGTVPKSGPKLGKKSSASATKWIKRNSFATVEECYKKLHASGFTIFATHLGRRSRPLYDLDLTGNVAFVFGNEHRGVSDEAAELADENFRIPMKGMIESLNVSVACAVTLFEALRQRTLKGMYDTPQLSPRAMKKLYDEWIAK